MEEIKIRLTTAEEVREFVRAARKCEFDVDISYGRAVVDGKSIMGIFSLDLSKPIDLGLEHLLTVNCHGENPEFRQSIGKFAQEA